MKHTKSTQKTVTLDTGLWHELGNWLDTTESKELGFHSKAQFVTEAVRELLLKYKNVIILKELGNMKNSGGIKNKKFDSAVKNYMRFVEGDMSGTNHHELMYLLQMFRDRK